MRQLPNDQQAKMAESIVDSLISRLERDGVELEHVLRKLGEQFCLKCGGKLSLMERCFRCPDTNM